MLKQRPQCCQSLWTSKCSNSIFTCRKMFKLWLVFFFLEDIYHIYSCTSQTSDFSSQKSDFSSFLIKEVKFRPIKMSQQVYLLFLRMYSKHRELKKLQSKMLPCAIKFVSTCSHHHNLRIHQHFDLLERYLTIFCKSHWIWNLLAFN